MWCSRFLLLLCVLNANIYADAKHLHASANLEDERIFQKYVELDTNLKKMVNRGVKMLLPYVMEANEHLNLSSNCRRDVFQLLSGIRNLKLYALKILDAIGKVPEGLFTGNVIMYGDYDECMTTSVLHKDRSVAFKGQYCLVYVRPLLPKKTRHLTLGKGFEGLLNATQNSSEVIKFLASSVQMFYNMPTKFGLCVPSGCSSEDISLMLNYLGDRAYINATVAYCDQQDSPQDLYIVVGRKIAIIACLVFGLFTLIGSSMDYYSKKKGFTFKNVAARLLLCFSILTNFPKVISTKMSFKSLNCLFGVRSLSLFYIILMHEYYCQAAFITQGHLLRYKEEFTQFFMQIALNGYLTTEVFFFLGGFLNTYSRMKIDESGKGKLNPFQIIIHRLWRIYPVYLFSMLASFLLASAKGPNANFSKQEFLDDCQTNGWRNILFINNFFDHNKACLPHTWYIAADMHLFLISLFTVPVLLRSAKKGIILHLVILVAGITGTVLWAWHKSLMPSTLVYRVYSDDMDRISNAYTSTLPHIAPYFTGMITGYILFAWKDFKIPLGYQFLGWPVAATCLISMLFITKVWNSGTEYTLVGSAFYFGFCRFLYVLAVAWMVVCCIKGYGGIFNYILSLKIWIPISRISYTMYLVSPFLQIYYFSNLRMLLDSSRMVVIWRYVGTLLISGLLALAMTAIVESPFITMEKILFKRKSSAEKGHHETYVEKQDSSITNAIFQTRTELKNNIKNTLGNMHLKQERDERDISNVNQNSESVHI